MCRVEIRCMFVAGALLVAVIGPALRSPAIANFLIQDQVDDHEIKKQIESARAELAGIPANEPLKAIPVAERLARLVAKRNGTDECPESIATLKTLAALYKDAVRDHDALDCWIRIDGFSKNNCDLDKTDAAVREFVRCRMALIETHERLGHQSEQRRLVDSLAPYLQSMKTTDDYLVCRIKLIRGRLEFLDAKIEGSIQILNDALAQLKKSADSVVTKQIGTSADEHERLLAELHYFLGAPSAQICPAIRRKGQGGRRTTQEGPEYCEYPLSSHMEVLDVSATGGQGCE